MNPPNPNDLGPVPEANQPGHHPEVEQDKPKPKRRARKAPVPPTGRRHQRSALRREEPFATISRLFGVTGDNGFVDVDDDTLEIRFGPWHLKTPVDNIDSAQVTGPFHWWKVIGPAHVSLKDRGITFATSNDRAVCIKFRDPVPAVDPLGVIKHPGVTVTVEDPEGFVRFLDLVKAA